MENQNNLESVKRFIELVRQQSRAKNRVLNMPLTDAQDLSNALSLMLCRENELLNKLVDTATTKPTIINGGSFDQG
jgi:hypothetical protein